MAVTLTAQSLKLRASRLLESQSVAEVAELLSRVTDQVAAWVTEAAANTSAIVTMSQFYENELATVQAQILALTDRVAAQRDIEVEDTTTFPVGESRQARKQHKTASLERALETLIKERNALLNKLGISTTASALPSLGQTCIRADDYTGEDADPGIDWEARNDDPSWLDR